MDIGKFTLGGVVALGLALTTGMTAKAAAFDWTASGLNGYTAVGSGVIDATPLGAGAYSVTSMTGTWAGLNITGLTVYAGEDNLVYVPAPSLDYPGLAFTVADGTAYNFYYDTSTDPATDPYSCGFVGYCEVGPGIPFTTGLGPPSDAIKPISFSLAEVPEPATWAMMLFGFGGLGAAIRGRRGRQALTLA